MLAGLATTGLTAVAAAQPWFRAPVDHRAVIGIGDAPNEADMPLALACALVMLAGWGVVLVTGAVTRRAVLVVGFLAGLVVAGCAVRAPFVLPDQVTEQLEGAEVAVGPTGWYVAACVAVVLAVATMVAGWRLAPRWPTMSSRYDAPATATATDPASDPAAEADDLALWKALDEGRDPTQR